MGCSPENGENGVDGQNGLDGLNSLVQTLVEQPGANCESGGFRVETGLDINRNGTLDVGEVQNSEFICNTDSSDFPYQNYVSLLSQSGTQAPVANILENSLGVTITWERESAGVYLGTLDQAIDISKSVIFYSTPPTHTIVRGTLMNTTLLKLELQNGTNAFLDNFTNLSFELRQYE